MVFKMIKKKAFNIYKNGKFIYLLGFLTLLILPTIKPVTSDLDIARGRGYIDKVEWTQMQGTWAFEVIINVKYARNVQTLSAYASGQAYVKDHFYEDGFGQYNYEFSDRWTGSSGVKATNYYVTESFFRRGTSSGEDGLNVRIRIRKWGFFFFPIDEGYTTIKDWHWIDVNSDDTWDTGWINGLKVTYGLDIIAT